MHYQNLHPNIYVTQFNGNTRFDLLTALYAVWHRQPDLFQWPVDETGRVRFKLDCIALLNGYAGHNAHDALGDVEATIHTARQIAQRAPELWTELLGNQDKGRVQARLQSFQPLALVERFGGGLPRATMGCFCGYSTVARFRARWRAHQHRLDPKHLIFIDEIWIKTNMTRTCGWATTGKRLTAHVPHGHWKTLTFLAGLRHDRIVAPFVLDGPINGDTFTAWVGQCHADARPW